MTTYQYHHFGIPTDKPLLKEDYSEKYKMNASGYFQNPYGIEWMTFDHDCPLPELVKTVPHVAFVVDDLQAAIADKEVIIEPNSPIEEVMVAFIVDNGAPIEFLQFDKPESEIWPNESPAVTKQGWRYHHIGIPTETPQPGEQYLEDFKLYVSGFEISPYGIEWMRFEEGCPISELVKTVPHIAFEVDDLYKEIQGKELLGEVSSPSEGLRVAMIIDNGAPVELLEFQKVSKQ